MSDARPPRPDPVPPEGDEGAAATRPPSPALRPSKVTLLFDRTEHAGALTPSGAGDATRPKVTMAFDRRSLAAERPANRVSRMSSFVYGNQVAPNAAPNAESSANPGEGGVPNGDPERPQPMSTMRLPAAWLQRRLFRIDESPEPSDARDGTTHALLGWTLFVLSAASVVLLAVYHRSIMSWLGALAH